MKAETLKLIFAILAVIAAVGFYSYSQVVGNTFFNTTITTNVDLENGLIGHWTFDGEDTDWGATSAEILDRSSSGADGDATSFSSEAVVPGNVGQAVILDGSADYVDFGDTNDITGSFTLSAWINRKGNASAAGVSGTIIGKEITSSAQYTLEIIDSDHTSNQNEVRLITFGLADNSLYSSRTITNNAWHHVVATWDGTTKTIYIDGVSSGSEGTSGSMTGNSESLKIGYGAGTSGVANYFNGAIDDVRLYNRALSQDEITRLHQLGATTHINTTITSNPDLENGLVGHWTFDGDYLTSATAIDRTSFGNDLTRTTSPENVPGRIGQGMYFNGSSYLYNSSVSADLRPTSVTVASWVRSSTNNGSLNDWVAAQGDNYGLVIDRDSGSDDVLFYYRYSSNWSSVSSGDVDILDGEWHHIAGIYDAANDRLYAYKDGIKVGDDPGDGAISYTQGNEFAIAAMKTGRQMTGNIDDVRVYNRVLSDDEITRLHQLGATTHINTTITSNPDLENGLVRHYTFDGNDIDWGVTNELLDRSSSGVDADAVSMDNTKTVIGNIGQALNFDGSTDYGNIATMPTMTEWTIAAWANAEATVSGKNILSNDRGGWNDDVLFGIRPEPVDGADNQWGVTHQDSTDSVRTSAFDTSGMITGRWYHVAAWSDGTNLKLFVDGVEKASTPKNGTALTFDGAATRIGATPNTFRGFDGDIDDVRVYDRALSDGEMMRLYQLGN